MRQAPGEARGSAAEPAAEPRRPLPLSATTLIRGMFQPPGALPMPGPVLPADWLDLPLLATALHRWVSRSNAFADCSAYKGEPAGDARLRQALSQRLAERKVQQRRQRILTTWGPPGAGRGTAHLLAQRGDAVLVDEPGWAVEYARLAAQACAKAAGAARRRRPDLARWNS